MKSLFTAILLLVISIASYSQCGGPRFATIGVVYTYHDNAHGIGFEAGSTGDDSPLSAYAGGTVYIVKPQAYNKDSSAAPKELGMLYTKIAYRIIRIDYILSVSPFTLIGYDAMDGLQTDVGIRFLRPMGNKAITIEPAYSFTQKKPYIQASIMFPL